MSNSTIQVNLQKALRMELTATHQYQVHAHVLDDWGLDKLASKMREESLEEQGHLNSFIARLMFVGGTPDLEFHQKPVQAASLTEMFRADLKDEEKAIAFYSCAAQEAASAGNIVTRSLFEQAV